MREFGGAIAVLARTILTPLSPSARSPSALSPWALSPSALSPWALPPAAVAAALALAAAVWIATAAPKYARSRLAGTVQAESTGWHRRMLTMLLALARDLRKRPRGRRALSQRRAAALETCLALSAELRAGQPVRLALQRAALVCDPPVCPAALAAARLGGDVPAALRADAAVGLPVLRGMAACWQVGESSGAGLALAIERMADSARAADEVREQLATALAGPRATARLLGSLPLVGIAMGMLMGANPLAWLLGSAYGLVVLAAGIALTGLGLWWTDRIAKRVERLL